MRKTRKVSESDRHVYHENALKGTAKWKRMPKGARRASNNRTRHGWGFEGSAPNTHARKYKTKKQ